MCRLCWMYTPMGTSLPTVWPFVTSFIQNGSVVLDVHATGHLVGDRLSVCHLVHTERMVSKHYEHPCGFSCLCWLALVGSMVWFVH